MLKEGQEAGVSEGTNDATASTSSVVKYRKGKPFKITMAVLYAILYFFFLIGLPIVLVEVGRQVLGSSARTDVLILLVLVLLYGLVLYYSYRGLKEWKEIVGPDSFNSKGFTYMLESHSWIQIECAYMNPSMDYLVLLFKDSGTAGAPAGVSYLKRNFEPSLEAFLALLKTAKVPIYYSTQLTISDLFKIQEMRLKGRDLG